MSAGQAGAGRRRRLAPALLLCALAWIHAGAQEVPPAALERPRVALVLGGGAARGAAHIGIIRALNEAGVPIDLIVGTSMGSLVGGLYAAGVSTDTLESLFAELSPAVTAELLFPPRGGILDTTPLAFVLGALVNDLEVADTVIPFVAVATPLETNVPEPLTSGRLATAIHASTTIPLVFAPVELNGLHYYDGGVKAAVPVLIARDLGAEVVIAVDVTREVPFDPDNVLSNVQAIYLDVIEGFNVPQLAAADIVLDPGLRRDSYMSFDRTASFLDRGYRTMAQRLPEVLTLLEDRHIPLATPGDPHRGHPLNAAWRGRLREGRRRAADRARPLSIGLDLGLAPSSYQDGYTMPAVAPLSVAKVGFDATGGSLGPWRIGATVGTALDSDAIGLSFRVGYRPVYALELAAAAEREVGRDWDVWLAARYHHTDFDDMQAAASLSFHLPAARLDLDATFETTGVLARAGVSLPISGDFVRGTLDLRTALAWGDMVLRVRGFAGGAAGNPPPAEHLGFGQPVLMRGVAPTPSTTVLVANLEAGWHAREGLPLAEVVVLHPEVWGFVDVGYAAPDVTDPLVSLGAGAGVTGAIFGIEPFDLAFDVGYGPAMRQLTFGVRTRIWPTAFAAGGTGTR